MTSNSKTYTDQQYERAVQSCKEIFIKKTKDYGTSWRVLRIISIADQLFIKARRIRTVHPRRAPGAAAHSVFLCPSSPCGRKSSTKAMQT